MPLSTYHLITPLLDRLFAEAAALEANLARDTADITAEERADYRLLYRRLNHQPLAVSPETGRLLYILARTGDARQIVEFGTSFGLSTLSLAAAVRDNGGGLVIGTEFEPAKAARARQTLDEAGLADLVEIREGDALHSLARDLPARIDLVLLDGAKSLYSDILGLLESRLRTGALIVADNADMSPDYLARVRSADSGYLSVPFAGDVELSLRIRH